jgi:hypothetical protein
MEYILVFTRVVRKKFQNEKKTIVPLPLQVNRGVPNQIQIDELHAEDIHLHDHITVRSEESFRFKVY